MDHIKLSYTKGMYYLRYLTLTTLTVLFTFSLSAQNNNIILTGKIIDHATSLPLEGATVHIKGTTHEVITDKTGEFKFITAQKVPVVYVVSFVGYQTQEVPASEVTGVQ